MRGFKLGIILLGFGTWLWLVSPLKAQDSQPVSLNHPAITPSSSSASAQTQAQDQKKRNEEPTEEPEKEEPFAPNWSGQLVYSYSSQPSEQGQGQITNDFTLTGTYNLTETGHYFSAGIVGGTQLVEGITSNYGGVNLEGGLGFDFFQPALSLELQQGAQALSSQTSTLILNFRFWDPLTIGLSSGAGISSHQGPVSEVSLRTSDKVVEIDTYNWNLGATVDFAAWDFLGFSLGGQREYDVTYQFQNVIHTVVNSVNQTDVISYLSLGANITFWEHLVLGLTGQAGYENYPEGPAYSPILGRTVNFSAPTTQNFTSWSIDLTYNFQ
jgi:hypothetical protein